MDGFLTHNMDMTWPGKTFLISLLVHKIRFGKTNVILVVEPGKHGEI